MQVSEIPKSSGQCIQIDQKTTIVLLNYPTLAYLCGILNVKAIRGTVRILGYDLSPSKPPLPVYSLKDFNTLKVVSVNDLNTEDDTLYLRSLPIPAHLIESVLQTALCYSYIFIVTKNEESDGFVSFFRNSDLPVFAKTDTDNSMVRLSSIAEEDNPLVESSQWDELADEFLPRCRKIIICGGRNVGKSTFLRYLVNRHLVKWGCVLVIDFDPGQSEFTVMGCLSAVLVKRPLLGPNFSHITDPERSIYLGDISVTSCPKLYSESVEKLFNFCDCDKYKDIPWIINTMGFVKGLGISLLTRIMETIKPTDIVQMMSEKDFNNFPGHLTPSFFNLDELKHDGGEWWKPRLHTLSSMAERASGMHLREAFIKRDIVTMSYLKKALGSAETDLLSIPPKKIKTDDVQIVIVKPTSKEIVMTMTTAQKLCCINANLVALCTGNCSDQLDCLGFGVVRGFDMDTNYIYVITPISEDALKRVTVIKMSSNVQLPQALYRNHVDKFRGPYAYFGHKIPNTLNQCIRKTSSRLRYAQDSRSSSGFHESAE